VGTGSPRRAAQLRALRPDLEIVDIRGNVGTRIGRVKGLEEHSGKQVVLRQNAETDEHADRGVGTERLGDCDAVVLAVSGLKRLGKEHLITEYLDPSRMLPAPGQGALALEVRESEFGNPDPAVLDDAELARPTRSLGRALIAANHYETRLAVSAERALLRRLEAGCAAPIGAFAEIVEGDLVLSAVVASPDGTDLLRHTSATSELDVPGAERLGVRVADPARKIVALSGDYDFQFMIEELAVGAQFKLPYIHVLVNNSYLGLIRQAQRAFSIDYCVQLAFDNINVDDKEESKGYGVDHVKVVEGLGCKAIRVHRPEDFAPAMQQAEAWMAEHRTPVVVEVILERVTNISMGAEIDNVIEFEALAAAPADVPSALALLD